MNPPAAALRHPALELLARYAAVLRAAWNLRHSLAGPKRLADEAAFLPAALSLQETPAHPAPRRAAIAICALFVIALAWATIGEVDIVAVAPGRIVVSERTKTLQPLETSVVKRLLVKDGDEVKAGQVLVELDATNASADAASVQEQLSAVTSEEQRAAALQLALQTNRPPVLPAGGAIEPAARERDTAQLNAEWRDITAKLARNAAEQSRSAYLAETRRALSERQAQASLKRQQLTQERSKTEQRSRLTQLTAPVAGTVQQVAVHTEGGVVTPAQVLMIIVPKDAQVSAEVVIDNKDIGFVNAGQAAQIKLETFPYTRYGVVEAQVKSVTADAVNDEKRGAIFPATLTLSRASIDVEGKRINLSPGMNVTAEIKTGKRRVIDYLLSPVQRHVGESLKER